MASVLYSSNQESSVKPSPVDSNPHGSLDAFPQTNFNISFKSDNISTVDNINNTGTDSNITNVVDTKSFDVDNTSILPQTPLSLINSVDNPTNTYAEDYPMVDFNSAVRKLALENSEKRNNSPTLSYPAAGSPAYGARNLKSAPYDENEYMIDDFDDVNKQEYEPILLPNYLHLLGPVEILILNALVKLSLAKEKYILALQLAEGASKRLFPVSFQNNPNCTFDLNTPYGMKNQETFENIRKLGPQVEEIKIVLENDGYFTLQNSTTKNVSKLHDSRYISTRTIVNKDIAGNDLESKIVENSIYLDSDKLNEIINQEIDIVSKVVESYDEPEFITVNFMNSVFNSTTKSLGSAEFQMLKHLSVVIQLINKYNLNEVALLPEQDEIPPKWNEVSFVRIRNRLLLYFLKEKNSNIISENSNNDNINKNEYLSTLRNLTNSVIDIASIDNVDELNDLKNQTQSTVDGIKSVKHSRHSSSLIEFSLQLNNAANFSESNASIVHDGSTHDDTSTRSFDSNISDSALSNLSVYDPLSVVNREGHILSNKFDVERTKSISGIRSASSLRQVTKAIELEDVNLYDDNGDDDNLYNDELEQATISNQSLNVIKHTKITDDFNSHPDEQKQTSTNRNFKLDNIVIDNKQLGYFKKSWDNLKKINNDSSLPSATPSLDTPSFDLNTPATPLTHEGIGGINRH